MMNQMAERSTPVVIELIQQIIEEHVRPYIEMDGGSIEFVRLEDRVAYVRLAGACSSCPSSMVTLKGGVERHIRRRVPEVLSVEMEDAPEEPIVDSFMPVTIQLQT